MTMAEQYLRGAIANGDIDEVEARTAVGPEYPD
jgi:hypothetical protein